MKDPRHFVRISADLREDLKVWDCFLVSFNGCCFWKSPFCNVSALPLFTDASGACGYGVFWDGHWSASSWPVDWIERGLTSHIVFFEIFPILVALELWGDKFSNSRLLFHSYNRGVAFAINCMSSKSHPVIAVLRQVVFKCLLFNIWVKAKYVPGHFNIIADALSRSQQKCFRTFVPDADLQGLPCPTHLWSIV